MKRWLIVGATSGIARALNRRLAAKGCALYLADREAVRAKGEMIAEDLRIRFNVEVRTGRFEALEMDGHAAFVERVENEFGPLDGVVWLSGVMPPQEEAQSDFALAKRQHEINYVAAMGVLGEIANRMEQRGCGHIVGFCSPAGDRGRKSNYLYGADKAALNALLQGLRHRLAPKGIPVLSVKPGPVDTPMTAGMDNLPLLAKPGEVARDVARAIEKGSTELYTPWKWRFIMLVIRHMPFAVFKRLDL